MARSFNGSSDKMVVTNASVFNISVGTIGGWINTSVASGGANNIFIHGRAGGSNSGGFIFLLTSGATPNFQVAAWDTGGTLQYDASGGSALNDGKWHHVCWVFTTANGGTSIGYVDGTQVLTSTNSAAWSFAAANTLQWGITPSGPWANMAMSCADWFWSSSQLNAGNVASLANGVRPPSFSNIVGYWPLDGYASPETDLSGNGNTGTLTGTSQVLGPPALWRISG